MSAPVTVGLVSLGCAKNAVDLQVIAAHLLRQGFVITPDEGAADVLIVNTCAFIESAREEALREIGNALAVKADPKSACRLVVVSGCFAQRYPGLLAERFGASGGVDAVVGIDRLDSVGDTLRALLADRPAKPARGRRNSPCAALPQTVVVDVPSGEPHRLFSSPLPEFTVLPGPAAYLKIAEGCSHVCAFCAIPGIRGRLRSRAREDILDEARALLASGIRELIVIAQDVTAYGRDLKRAKGASPLVALLRELDALEEVGGPFWIRLLYGHPNGVTDDLLAWMATSRHACRYLDVPLQHSHPDVLRAMRRAETVPAVEALAARARAAVPGVCLRTTFLVGFPGETPEMFDHLMSFLEAQRYDHVGAFAFSPEEGTAAVALPTPVPPRIAEQRRRRLMKRQEALVKERNKARVGTEGIVLVESVEQTDEDGDGGEFVAFGRSEFQAPEDVDGHTVVRGIPQRAARSDFAKNLRFGKIAGTFVRVRYASFRSYDLLAEYLGPAESLR